MNFEEADALVTRMTQAWRVPFGQEWIDSLQDLDAGKAGTAFVRMKNTEKKPPSIAEFRAAVGAIQGVTNIPKCHHCDGTGMVAPSIDAWGTESDPCEFCDLGKLQAERIRAPRPEAPGRLSERTCDIGMANVIQMQALLEEQRRNKRRAS